MTVPTLRGGLAVAAAIREKLEEFAPKFLAAEYPTNDALMDALYPEAKGPDRRRIIQEAAEELEKGSEADVVRYISGRIKAATGDLKRKRFADEIVLNANRVKAASPIALTTPVSYKGSPSTPISPPPPLSPGGSPAPTRLTFSSPPPGGSSGSGTSSSSGGTSLYPASSSSSSSSSSGGTSLYTPSSSSSSSSSSGGTSFYSPSSSSGTSSSSGGTRVYTSSSSSAPKMKTSGSSSKLGSSSGPPLSGPPLSFGLDDGRLAAAINEGVRNALHKEPTQRENLDDEPWERTHPTNDTARLKYGASLLHNASMRPGKEEMPEEPFLGNKGLARGDIVNQGELKYNPGGTSRIERPDQKLGDVLVSSKQSMDTSTDTLRTLYKEANPQDVIPTKEEQILSDIMFDSFSTVLPGWGLGMQNKMFLMEEEREEKILYAEPMYEPRPDIGPVSAPDVIPPEWRPSMSKRNRQKDAQERIRDQMLASILEQRTGSGSLNILGDDAGFLRSTSDRGLPRDKESCFEPIVVNAAPWQPVKVPCGYDLRRVLMRKQHDALRAPAKLRPSMAQDGGPTFPSDYAYNEMYSAPAMS